MIVHSHFSEFNDNSETLSYVTLDNGTCVTTRLRQNLKVTTFFSAFQAVCYQWQWCIGCEKQQYYFSQTCDRKRFEARKVGFSWECLNIFAIDCSIRVHKHIFQYLKWFNCWKSRGEAFLFNEIAFLFCVTHCENSEVQIHIYPNGTKIIVTKFVLTRFVAQGLWIAAKLRH